MNVPNINLALRLDMFLGAVVFLVVILWLLKKGRLTVRYSIIWLMAGGALASADALQNGAPIVNIDSLKTQDAFTHDETTGAWSLIPNRTQAALDAIGNGYGRSSGDGTLFMYVSLEGNTLDNTITPTLNVCMISGTEVNGRGIAVDRRRAVRL